MVRASTAHPQEIRFMYVANGTCKMTVRSLPVILQYHLPQKHTLPPDDGLLMPETCRSILIQ
jgi:hypothetical protein